MTESRRSLSGPVVLALVAVGVTMALGLLALGTFGVARIVDKQETKGEDACSRGEVKMLEIFLQPTASPSDIDAVRRRLAEMPDVRRVRFIDQTEAFKIFTSQFADCPRLSSAIQPSDLPPSFRVTPRSRGDAQRIADRLAGQPGVLNIAVPKR